MVLLIGTAAFLVALYWTFKGYWIILPFAGLEVGLLAFLSYRVSLDSYHRQRIRLQESHIVVEWGRRYPKRRWRLQRENTILLVERPDHSLSPDILYLKDDQQQVRLGEKLGKEDIEALQQHLRGWRIPVRIQGVVRRHAGAGFDALQ